MGKLHEVLAVETDLKATADKLLKETLNTFKSKEGHFEATEVRFHPLKEDGINEAPEVKPMVDTIAGKIAYTTKNYAKYVDAVFQKEATNQIAKADLLLDDGQVLAKDVPATVLLGLESKLKEVRAMYEQVPTLAPGEDWKKDEQSGHFKAVSERVRTMKEQTPVVTYEATKEHPAQVVMMTKDVRVGRVVTTKQSSLLTSADKATLLGRVDALIQATKKARMRANNVDVKAGTIGETIFSFIHKGVIKEA